MCLAIPGRIDELHEDGREGVCDVMGVRRRVNLDLLRDDPPGPGDWVLIHVGFAMSRISAERADEQHRLLALLGGEDEAREEASGYGRDAVVHAPAAPAASVSSAAPGRCPACADEAIEMVVVAREGGDARVRRRDGAETVVAVDLVPDVRPGARVLVHGGVAIAAVGSERGEAAGEAGIS